MSIDVIGNFLTIIRNGILSSKREVVAPYSKIKAEIARILKDEGFIRNFEIVEEDKKKFISVELKYIDGESVIHEIKRISTPGRRVYHGGDNLEHVVGKLGISIVTTNEGVLTNKQARDLSIGGEVICTVW